MRALTCEELSAVFSKLAKYNGGNLKLLLERSDGDYVFRFNRGRVYYVKESISKKASCISRKNLISIGACFGKFTKSNKFRLHITALDYIAPYAIRKIWVKNNMEQQFLYGHNIQKAGVSKISDEINQYDGVVVFNLNDVPLGFGIGSRGVASASTCQLGDLICLHQADLGEYLRNEDTLL